jgi:hypothetical protein
MGKVGFSVILVMVLVSSMVQAEIVVHEPNFVVDVLLDQIDGQTPRLEAIRNPYYGFGVMAASVDNGILTVKRISQYNITIEGIMTGFPTHFVSVDIRFDNTTLFSNDLFVSVASGPHNSETYLIRFPFNEDPNIFATVGSTTDGVKGHLVFCDGSEGYPQGMLLFDGNCSGGA